MVDSAPVLPKGRFYGITRSVTVGGATLSEVYHHAPRELPLHGHEAAHFCMLLEGEYHEACDGTELTYGPFTIAFHPVGMRHVDTIGPTGAHFFIVELDENWTDTVQTFLPSPTSIAELRGGDAVWTALRLYLELRGGSPTELTVESAIYELVGALPTMQPLAADDESGGAVTHVERLIEARYAEALSLTSLADAVGLHAVHLARVFRRQYHRSVGESIQGRRIQAASRALLESDQAVAEIAVACGFFDHSHFNRVFRSVTGTTPTQYRKRLARSHLRDDDAESHAGVNSRDDRT